MARKGGLPGATGNWLWIAAAASLALSLTPWGPLVLYPFKVFTTWVHECSHALMTLAVGGSVSSIAIEPDTSGLTRSLIPTGRIARALVSSAGYLGASVVGCLLMAATRVESRARAILWTIGALMLVTIVIWIRNPFGFAAVLAWGVALILLARRPSGNGTRFLLSLLAIQVALNAVYDIRVLFGPHRGFSDADGMARLFLLPSWIWAGAWMLISLSMLAWTLWSTRGRR
jgi:hypothetical protein